MNIEIYIFFQIVTIIMFLLSFFNKQEILWAISLIFSGMLAYTAYNIQYYVYQYNAVTMAYDAVLISHSHPTLFGVNLLFFVLGMILMIFDLFDKYGKKFAGVKSNEE